MRKKLWLLFSGILIIIILAILVDLPRSPLRGGKIKTQLGLDLIGGTELVYEADLSGSADKLKDLNNLVSVFRHRVDQLGVSEPTIQTAGGNRVIIELPGIKDINEAINKIGATYELSFMEEADEATGAQMNDYYDPAYTYPKYWKATDLTGRQLKTSEATFQNQNQNSLNSEAVVSISFDNAGREKFREITKRNLQKQVAIVLDNKIVSAPMVQAEITDGNAVITGSKDIKEAQQLAKRLNEGMLPVPTKLIAQQNVGATLGQDSLKKSLVAGFIGIFVICLFMIVYYKTSGLIASLALLIYAILTLAIFKLIPVTLTLAGIAGFILSVGMAVDANILIFERMREELAGGKVLNLAVQDGFKRAWNSVRDSNSSSLITCAILYYAAGSGPVKGFALTLAIGIIVSLFTAVTLTRTILLLISGSRLKGLIHV